MSIFVEYVVHPNKSSGGRYHKVMTRFVSRFISGFQLRASPQSAIFNSPLLLMSKLDALRSLCMILFMCMKCTPFNNWLDQDLIWSCVILISFVSITPVRSYSRYSKAKKTFLGTSPESTNHVNHKQQRVRELNGNVAQCFSRDKDKKNSNPEIFVAAESFGRIELCQTSSGKTRDGSARRDGSAWK